MQFDPYESLSSVFVDHSRNKSIKTAEVPASAAGGLSRMSKFSTSHQHELLLTLPLSSQTMIWKSGNDMHSRSQ